MTNFRLFPSTNGPSAPVSYSGNILTGVMFKVTQGGTFCNGVYQWCPATGDTVSRKVALWNLTPAGAQGTLLASATTGALTAGAWNFTAFASPVALSIGAQYCACTGWSATAGFPDSDIGGAGTGAGDSYGTGGHTSGITQGPLFAFSDNSGAAPPQYGGQGVFGTSGTDPTVTMPLSNSNSGNFWVDVQVSDTAPAGYTGSYRMWPNRRDLDGGGAVDASVSYVIATEFSLSQACVLNKIWYYSYPGSAQLATSCRVWQITGADSGTLMAASTSPTWSGIAGSGWVSCTFGNVVLQHGAPYKVTVYNGAGTPDGWSGKQLNYWSTGPGASGITAGPLTVPNLASASQAYVFNGGNAGSSPQYTTGVIEAGQSTFVNGTGDAYPYLYVDTLAQTYWVDVEVTPTVPPKHRVVLQAVSRAATY